ncbi:SMP-30/gluconolactonase/LRE family protein [Sphingomonas sp. DT-51]|uniref:SMP-30/gluconolactonase/LRE family protein n=1 Tax=Sphingomonas sp. DT-51 TaxID=3396165 RepID=UPI003F1DDEE3
MSLRYFGAPIILLLTVPVAPAQTVPAQSLPPSRLVENVGFSGSECARYDDRADEYLVANMGPAQGQGFISRVSPNGQVTNLKWIEGGRDGAVLARPLGLFIKGDIVYVADPTAVHMFDRRTGAPRGTIAVSGSERLNDLTVDDDGTIYVTDSGSDAVSGALWVIRGGRTAPWVARDDALERPNGIALTHAGEIVHGGRGVNLVFRDKNGRIRRERSLPVGRIDGIVPLADGSLLVASQDGHAVYHVPPTGPARAVASDIAVPAAIGYDPKRHRLLVPQIRLASLAFYNLPR